MNSYAHKVDNNQKQIVDELRALGYTVANLSRAGAGIPDLVVGDSQRIVWVEVKRKGQKLTPYEQAFFNEWAECTRIIAYCTEDVLRWFGRLS
jgi:hypothetical protein